MNSAYLCLPCGLIRPPSQSTALSDPIRSRPFSTQPIPYPHQVICYDLVRIDRNVDYSDYLADHRSQRIKFLAAQRRAKKADEVDWRTTWQPSQTRQPSTPPGASAAAGGEEVAGSVGAKAQQDLGERPLSPNAASNDSNGFTESDGSNGLSPSLDPPPPTPEELVKDLGGDERNIQYLLVLLKFKDHSLTQLSFAFSATLGLSSRVSTSNTPTNLVIISDHPLRLVRMLAPINHLSSLRFPSCPFVSLRFTAFQS